jgi:hypothetical protein
VNGIGIEGGEERKSGSGLLGGARGTPYWRAIERPLSGGHEEWDDGRDNALGMSEAEEKREELKSTNEREFAKRGVGELRVERAVVRLVWLHLVACSSPR